jgi:senataxin
VFLDIAGKEYQGKHGRSWANDEEATMAVALVCALMRDYPELASGEKIGVISPYKAQVKNLKNKLAEALGTERASFLDVGSIDGFQGREKDVCIFSVVRAPARGRGLGFVADERRINVGLTRAKNSLIVLGCAKALKSDKSWGGLVTSATKRNLMMKPPPGKDCSAFVAKFGAAYDADDLSGSEDEGGDEYGDGDGDDVYEKESWFVHRPNWNANGEDVEAPEGLNIAAAGFSTGADVELVTEAPVKGGGNDDYDGGAGRENDDNAPDPYAQEADAGGKRWGSAR